MSGNGKRNHGVAIIGAGLAGLTAANYLDKLKVPFILFESGPRIAGMAASFSDKDGFSYDFGAHFITNRLAAAIGIADECLPVRHYGEMVWIEGRSHSYPFGLILLPRMSASAVKGRLFGSISSAPTAADHFRKNYGHAMANEVALPLIEAWSGAGAEELSAAVGDSLPTSIPKTLYLKAASRFLGRAIACGYSRDQKESASVWHVYPKNGVSTLCEKLAEGVHDRIRLNSPVESIHVEDGRAVAVEANGKRFPISAVVSTAPANVLARLVKGTDRMRHLEKFKFRPMIFLNLKFEGRGLLPDTVLWFPEKKYPFFRLTEAPLSMPWLAPKGKTIITVDIGCQKGDDYWGMDEQRLVSLCLKAISDVIPNAESSFLGHNVLRTAFSYPVFLNEYEEERRQFEKTSSIENVLSIGRNGEFAHIFMEDVYWRTRKKVRSMLGSL